VRFRNDGGKPIRRAEAHAEYRLPATDRTRVTVAWSDARGERTAEHLFAADGTWTVPTGSGTRTRWVEMAPAP
jgi:hypothetical protein